MKKVFDTEREFLAARPARTLKQRGYRVKVANRVYFVWAKSRLEALGLVARTLSDMTVVAYTQDEVRHKDAEDIDPVFLGAAVALDFQHQNRLRELILRGLAD